MRQRKSNIFEFSSPKMEADGNAPLWLLVIAVISSIGAVAYRIMGYS